MMFKRPLALAVSLWMLVVWADDLTVGTIFNVHTLSDNGGCSPDQISTLNRWYDEAYDMLEAASDALDMYDTNEYVRKAVSTFFGVEPGYSQNDIEAITGLVVDVFNFLNDEPSRQFKPHIFCGSKFLELKPSNRLVQDKDGHKIPDPKRPGKFETIKQRYGSKLTGQNKAFWIDSLKVYEFGERRWGDQFCESTRNLAVTGPIQLDPKNVDTFTHIMTICPWAFSKTEYKGTLTRSGLAQSDDMADWQPKSLTFLHECFHVIAGGDMLAGDDEIYSVEACAQEALSDPSNAQQNPESYAYFAMAMWYLLKGDGDHYDFSSLKAERIS